MSVLAEKLASMEDQILSSGASAPSYDGQFGPKVNALATETAGQMHSTISRLKASASQLQAIAQLFEDADRETLGAIQGIGAQFDLESYLALLAQLSPVGSPPPPLRLDLSLEEFQAMSAAERLA